MGFVQDLNNATGSTSSFHANPAPILQQSGLQSQILNSQGNFSQNYGDQGQLAQALQAQMNGQGPNPAQLQYQQNVNQAIQQSAGQVASMKGINPALAARMAVQNQAGQTQQAAGNAATLQAQQQLASQSQLQNLYGQMGSQQLQNQSTLQGAFANQNQAINTAYGNANSINADTANKNAGANQALTGSILKGAGAGMTTYFPGAPAKAHGGFIPGKAEVPGDSSKNDNVPTMLSPGEIVIPRSHSGSKEKAKEFLDHLKGLGGESEGYSKVLEAHRKLQSRVAQLEKQLKKKA